MKTALILFLALLPAMSFGADYQIQALGEGNFFVQSRKADTDTEDGTISQLLSRESIRAVHGAFEYQTAIATGRQTTFQFGGAGLISNAQAAQRFGWSVRNDEMGAAEAMGGEGWGRSLVFQGQNATVPGTLQGTIEVESDLSGRVALATFECADGSCARDYTVAGFRGQGAIGLNVSPPPPAADVPDKIIDFDKESTWELEMPAVPAICPFAFP